jgi:uncharacterized Zn finger protein (UPF0148 family)
MSDFDKEAEREKLREKFEQEEDNRAATEQMSELLLKGATMTNAHCSECGDPIFRYDGQEFCPTCQKPVARDAQENGTDSPDADEQADDSDQIEVTDPSNEARVQFGEADEETGERAPDATDDPAQAEATHAQAESAPQTPPAAESDATPSTNDSDVPPEARADQPTRQSDRPESAPQTARTADSPETGRQSANERQSETPTQDPPVSARRTAASSGADDVAANLDAASGLLAETVHRFAERAAATDNPREAREHLQAAREAAEALDATRF